MYLVARTWWGTNEQVAVLYSPECARRIKPSGQSDQALGEYLALLDYRLPVNQIRLKLTPGAWPGSVVLQCC